VAFKDVFNAMKISENQIGLSWIGQAGFVIKTASRTIAIDPYLTNSVYRNFKSECGFGFKRLSPILFEPQDIIFDYLFASHEHGDHLDVDAVLPLTNNGITRLYTNEESAAIAVGLGVPAERIVRLEKGQRLQLDGFSVVIIPADHGDLSPNALGFLFDFGFASIYYSGDTAYNPVMLKVAIDLKPDIALLPINGAFGNLDARTATLLACDLRAKVCIPHHFWTFPMHLGNPQEAIELFQQFAPACDLVLQTPGDVLLYPG